MKAHFWLMVSLAFVALRAVLVAWIFAASRGMTEWGYVTRGEGGNFPELWACAAFCALIALTKTACAWWQQKKD